jgi:multiple sugar transport system permease protein
MAVSFLFATAMRKAGRWQLLLAPVFLLPLIIPSGAIVYLWDLIFRTEGLLNKFLLNFNQSPVNWAESSAILPIIVLIFLWKNVGFNVILFRAGLNLIPGEYYESMQIDGGGAFQQFKHITFVYLAPTSFLVLLMSIVNSFKSFKEIYLLFGARPSLKIYMLQHYVNNQFMSMNMSNMSVASYILALCIVAALLILYRAQKKLSESFS